MLHWKILLAFNYSTSMALMGGKYKHMWLNVNNHPHKGDTCAHIHTLSTTYKTGGKKN